MFGCAQDWLTASEYAVEGMASAKEAGSWSGPDVSVGQQAAAAAKAALIMAEVRHPAGPGRLIWRFAAVAHLIDTASRKHAAGKHNLCQAARCSGDLEQLAPNRHAQWV